MGSYVIGLYKIVISQQIKKVIANSHEKLNKLIISQKPQLLPAKITKNWLIRVEVIVCYISIVFIHSVLTHTKLLPNLFLPRDAVLARYVLWSSRHNDGQ